METSSIELSILLSPGVMQDYQEEQILKHNVNLSMKGENRLFPFLTVVIVTVGLNLMFYSSIFCLFVCFGRRCSEIKKYRVSTIKYYFKTVVMLP